MQLKDLARILIIFNIVIQFGVDHYIIVDTKPSLCKCKQLEKVDSRERISISFVEALYSNKSSLPKLLTVDFLIDK